MDHLADDVVVLVVIEEEDAVEEAAVGARIVEGDIEQVYGPVLDVAASLTAVPVNALQKLFVFDGGAILVVGVDLVPWKHQGQQKTHYSCTYTYCMYTLCISIALYIMHCI